MPTATKVPKQLPEQDTRWIDPATGKPVPDFYDYVKKIDALIRALRLEIP